MPFYKHKTGGTGEASPACSRCWSGRYWLCGAPGAGSRWQWCGTAVWSGRTMPSRRNCGPHPTISSTQSILRSPGRPGTRGDSLASPVSSHNLDNCIQSFTTRLDGRWLAVCFAYFLQTWRQHLQPSTAGRGEMLVMRLSNTTGAAENLSTSNIALVLRPVQCSMVCSLLSFM